MKIAIDARFYGPEGAGLGKYTEKLLTHLVEMDKENEYFIILRKANFHLFNPDSANFKKILVDARWYSLKEQLLIPRALEKIKPDLVHFPAPNIPLFWRGNYIVTIYDLTKIEFGKQASNIGNPLAYLAKQTIYNFVFEKAIKNSLKIIAGSESTKRKLISRFGVGEHKVTKIYAGPDEVFTKNPEKPDAGILQEVLSRYKVKKPFIIYIGNAFPYKNVPIVLEALGNINKKIYFVYTSSRNVFVNRLVATAERLGVKESLIITGYVPDSDLAILYKSAECLVFPSLSEGFGLPGVEAMASDCPVICSDIEVFREVYADAALYFNPKSPRDLANKINELLNKPDLRESLIKKGHIQAGKYSWKSLALETLNIYKGLTAQKSC